MTEAEWWTATDPTPMLEFLQGKVSDRKLRLFAVACCRVMSADFPSAEYGDMVRWAEMVAEGMAPKRHFVRIYRRFAERFNGKVATALYALAQENAMWSATEVTRQTRIFPPFGYSNTQSLVLRDIFGNPFRPATVDLSWLSSDVLALATGIYADKAFDRMPILADALMDAGCDSDDILSHCRQPSEHVRGCWVVDLLLGKG